MSGFYGVGSDADMPDEVRFLRSVTQLVQKRLEKGEPTGPSSQPAFFFLMPRPPVIPGDRETRRAPMLDQGLLDVTGRLWFVNKATSDGTAVRIHPTDDDAQLFDLVVDELQAGDVPAIIFDPRTETPQLRHYPNGLHSTADVELVDIDSQTITLEEVFAVIDNLYKRQFCTPVVQQNSMKLWANDAKHWPAENAEQLIQIMLQIGLNVKFPNFLIRLEQPLVAGRTDIEIEAPSASDRSKIVRHVVLELKVLRSFGSTGRSRSLQYNQDWTREGVEQAAAYRDELGSRLAALCCFDMRKERVGDKCFDHVRDLAARLSVELKSWHVFASAKDYRHAKLA